jgi:hypothetical protein
MLCHYPADRWKERPICNQPLASGMTRLCTCRVSHGTGLQ